MRYLKIKLVDTCYLIWADALAPMPIAGKQSWNAELAAAGLRLCQPLWGSGFVIEEGEILLPDGFASDVFALDAGQRSAQDAHLVAQSCRLINGWRSIWRQAKLFGSEDSVADSSAGDP